LHGQNIQTPGAIESFLIGVFAGYKVKACLQNALGGIGLWPVVSAVSPETICGMNIFGSAPAKKHRQSKTKSGGTPDFTGGRLCHHFENTP
jgi:hypothetical protein